MNVLPIAQQLHITWIDPTDPIERLWARQLNFLHHLHLDKLRLINARFRPQIETEFWRPDLNDWSEYFKLPPSLLDIELTNVRDFPVDVFAFLLQHVISFLPHLRTLTLDISLGSDVLDWPSMQDLDNIAGWLEFSRRDLTVDADCSALRLGWYEAGDWVWLLD